MTTVPGTPGWAGAHRRVLTMITIAVTLAAALALAITLLVTSNSPAPAAPRTATVEWPVDPQTLTDKEKCELARVRVC